MESTSQPELADMEINGFAAALPKSAPDSNSDKQPNTAIYTGPNQVIPQNICVLNNTTPEDTESIPAEQAPSTAPSTEPSSSELAACLERQHLDQDNDNEEEGVSENGSPSQQVADTQEHYRIDTSDPETVPSSHIRDLHTDHNGESGSVNSALASEPAHSGESTLKRNLLLDDQETAVDEEESLETGEPSSSQPTHAQPGRSEATGSFSAVATTVEAAATTSEASAVSDENIESLTQSISPIATSPTVTFPNITSPSPTTMSPTATSPTPIHPYPRREPAPVTVTTNRIWESDKDTNECRRCKRRFNFLVRRHHCRRCGQVVCDRCSTHRANMARAQIVQDPSIPNWQHAQLANQPQRICDRCYTEMRPVAASRSATAPPSQPQRMPGHAGRIRKSSSSQSIMSECPVCGKRLSDISLDKSTQEEHVQTCLNVGSPSVATVRYVSYKLPDQSPLIGQECLICFEEFEPGDTIARLTCLCSYHRPCIREWLEKGKGCPLHFQISMGI